MRDAPHIDPDHLVERLITRVLRGGVWGSSALFILGIVVMAVFPTESGERVSFTQLIISPNAFTLLYAGTLLMILTPFVRVLLAVIGFAKEGDRRFVGVSLFVFSMLICGALVALLRTH